MKAPHNFMYMLPTKNLRNPSLPRFEIFPDAQTFCGKPELRYSILAFLKHAKNVSLYIQTEPPIDNL